jgi:hypothetical protein
VVVTATNVVSAAIDSPRAQDLSFMPASPPWFYPMEFLGGMARG